MRAVVETLKRYGVGGVVLVTLLASTPFVYGAFLREVDTWIKVVITASFVVLTFLYNYYKDVRPLLDFAQRRNYFFDLACVNPLDDLRENFDPTVRLSVGEIRRGFTSKRSGLDFVYTLHMEGDLDKDLRLRLDQGAAGIALREKRFCVADMEDPSRPSHNLDERQLRLTEDLTLIFSMPIWKVKKLPGDVRDVTDEVIGVVNIDSKMKGARAFYEDARVESIFKEGEEVSLLEEVEMAMTAMSKTCSWIMS